MMTDEARNAATDDHETHGASAGADAGARADHSGVVSRDDHSDAEAGGGGGRAHAPLRLQDALEPRADGRYRVEELYAFHDRAFVENVFRAALGRPPDETEMESTLSDLRTSRRGKREIVEDLVFSEEGERGGGRERVAGVGGSRLKRRVRGLPIVGYLWQLIAGIARLPRLMRHQREFEAYMHAQQQMIAERVNDQERRNQTFFAEQLRLAMATLNADVLAHNADVLAHIADVREAVFMLSDALASLSASHAQVVQQRAQVEAQIAASLDTHQRGIVEQQHALEAVRRELEGQQRRLDAQEEFLIQEQRAIVEAQKAVLAEIEERLRAVESPARRAPGAPPVESHAPAGATDATRAAGEA